MMPRILTTPLSCCIVQVVNYSESRTAEDICECSSKMITFIDLAGHQKYLKTTVFGLTSYCPDFAMLVVSANTGIGCDRQLLGQPHSSQLCCIWSNQHEDT
ncbi:GTP binding protein [Ataeniobius toweri]|uniref:GTP binding protein n=1 Tax=Ataeniobius toweri TaxID=208326 RepID=A0ABU7AFK3_9TELE|nr:GTP binding protein [Ataeniobius toweri]